MSSSAPGRLLLLRHAHSSWALPGQRDHERPLDDRGRREALSIGSIFRDTGLEIDGIVTSSAVRAQETLAAFKDALGLDAPTMISDDLYALGPEAYLAAARRSGARSLLLVGHNPMAEDVVSALAPDGDAKALAVLKAGFPTAGLAVIEFDGPLAGIGPASGRLAAFHVPGPG
ncbi:hypothetical protein ASG43_18750 [Aureimonas sp. Leaf454]|uniref:SixA phosphatase family protein n=1 Tax=Aureimonas sp. Leaf454 TaxID=1736381 RepID=UPI0006FBF6B0|nr:histidine phosphatase family protein [Aureimonas sp. Leaf454]KQT53262.1 hypothetical protein ASG43_18750 [Aureimonas sp. Leaf454]